jgi:hypothetical protein
VVRTLGGVQVFSAVALGWACGCVMSRAFALYGGLCPGPPRGAVTRPSRFPQ